MLTTAGLLLSGALVLGQGPARDPANVQTSADDVLTPGDRVLVITEGESIRGRVTDLIGDSLMLAVEDVKLQVPLASVQRIDRIGDRLLNGIAIGGALGAGSALGLMVRLCRNCSDVSASLDPRLTLLGTLMGMGVGALVDAAIVGRKTLFKAGAGAIRPSLAGTVAAGSHVRRNTFIVLGRAGWGRLTDDEGSLGDGGAVGVGVVAPIGRRVGLQVAYDRHGHRRHFEFGRTFYGTEQLVSAKALFFLRPEVAVRPYAGIGYGVLESERISESPTLVAGPRGFPVPGPLEIFRRRSHSGVLGFATGFDARVARHLSVVGDLSLDLGGPEALGSMRLTMGAGWRF